MNLEVLCKEISELDLPTKQDNSHPDRNVVKTVRDRMELALSSEDLLIDCFTKEIDRLRSNNIGHGLKPFHYIPEVGIRIAFGHWAPGVLGLGPHTHTAWTITSVCRNALTVKTFDRDQSCRQRALVKKNQFLASQGSVGYIYEPSIHEPFNDTPQWSLSMHLISPRDGEVLPNFDFDIPGLRRMSADQKKVSVIYSHILRSRFRLVGIESIIRALASIQNIRAQRLLIDIYDLASSRQRGLICNLLRIFNPEIDEENDILYNIVHPGIMLRVHCESSVTLLKIDIPMTESLSVKFPIESGNLLRVICDRKSFFSREVAHLCRPDLVEFILNRLEVLGILRSSIDLMLLSETRHKMTVILNDF